MKQDLSVIPTRSIDVKLNFRKNELGHWGFVIPETEEYNNSTFYMPAIKTTKENQIHHAPILKFITAKLFPEERKKYFSKYKEQAIEQSQKMYMDGDEIAYSSFMSSLNSIVFLNTSNKFFDSGLLFIPENLDNLSSATKNRLSEIFNFLYEGNDETSQIVVVPSLEDTLINNQHIRIYDLVEYKSIKTGKTI